MQGNKLRRLGKIALSVASLNILTGFSPELSYTLRDNCQPERIVNLLPHWADEATVARELLYIILDEPDNNSYELELAILSAMERLDGAESEMREYANECNVND